MFDVVNNTIYLCKHGSHAYGLNTESSDIDLRGILIEPIDSVLSCQNNFEQAEKIDFSLITGLNNELCADTTIFGLRKFIRLAVEANPNVLELLFVEENERYIWNNRWSDKLLSIRDDFLSQKAYYTFKGYSAHQFRRLQNHRQWIVNPPSPPPTREEYGLPVMPLIPSDQLKAAFAAINKKLETWNFADMSGLDNAARVSMIETQAEILAEIQIGSDEKWKAAGRILSYDDNFMYLLDRERTYNGLKMQFAQFVNWQKTRNPARYATEVACLCDTKHASHLLRLYMEVLDVLNGNGLILKRPKEERELLLAFKTGKFGKSSFDKMMEYKEDLEKKVDLAFKNTKLPKTANVAKIDQIMREMYLQYWDFT